MAFRFAKMVGGLGAAQSAADDSGSWSRADSRRKGTLDFVVDTQAERALGHSTLPPAEADLMRRRVRERTLDLLDEWSKEAMELANVGVGLQYNPTETGGAQPLLRDFLSADLKNLPANHRRMKFRANRSLRDVEPSVAVQVKTIDLQPVEEDEV